MPFSRERSVLSVVHHRPLLRAVSTSTCCSGWVKTLSMFLAFTLQKQSNVKPNGELVFPLGMAISHRASSSLLPSYSLLFASPFYLVLGCIAVAVLGILLVLPYCHYVVCSGMPC